MPFNSANSISLLSLSERKKNKQQTTQESIDILSPISLVSPQIIENKIDNSRNPIIADKSEDGFFFSRPASIEETEKIKNKHVSTAEQVKEALTKVVKEVKEIFIPEE
jgi:hypothetical protein